jgi:ATP-dependent RNA helicase DDX27
MELKKGQNLLEHGDEIHSRPARTWFQSEKEKQNAKGTLVTFYDVRLPTSLQL